MKKLFFILCLFFTANATAQTIKVHPTGVNVNSQNPTVVFLTFGQIPAGYVPAEGVWCGELIPATPPALGFQCNPATIYGVLPARLDFSQASGNSGLTDIMSIPSSVARRAYQTAERGGSAGFFYVRRFVSTTGLPDQFVVVTCRMSGGGARVPFALTDVEFDTGRKEPVLFLRKGEKFPEVNAKIRYNGTGRLKGRWEVVLPGEEPPTEEDLLTEATLPVEDRANQRRYTQVERFNHLLPPTGEFTLKLENPDRVPLAVDGGYLLLLRIEATDDKEGDSNLAAVGAGGGIVHSGAVAGFPMPVLKFFVAGSDEEIWRTTALLAPTENADLLPAQPLVFSWLPLTNAAVYRLEFLDEMERVAFSALLPSPAASYRAPNWLRTRFADKDLRWRITAMDENGKVLSQTNARVVRLKN